MRKMKDSGIEWIGEIPESWKVTTIGMLFNAKAGGDAKPDLYSDKKDENHPYPVYTNTMDKEQVYAYTSSPVFEGNTITVTGRGDIGRAFYRTTPYDAIIRLLSLSPRTELFCPFYTYWIDVVPFFTDNAAVGQLSAAQIKSYKAISIPFPEQQKIATYLDTQCAHIDSVIEKTKQSIEEYKKLKQAVITQAVTKGVRGEREMKDSGVEWIGEIPINWTMLKMKRCLISAESGLSAVTNDDTADTGKYILRTSSVSSGVFKENEIKPVTEYALERLVCPVESRTVIMSRMNTAKMVGKCAYIEKDYPDYYIPDKLWKLKFNKYLSPKYAWFLINSEPIQGWFSCIATGSSDSMQNISLPDFYNTIAPIPHYEEQQEIAAYLDQKCAEIDTLITKKEQFLTELESYKKSMIYEYVTGKKEVEP